eukprot:1237331-Prymnesium_polylepis.2
MRVADADVAHVHRGARKSDGTANTGTNAGVEVDIVHHSSSEHVPEACYVYCLVVRHARVGHLKPAAKERHATAFIA